jgi:hypothetical protein
MGTPVYITDPVVAVAYNVHPGEWANVDDDAEAAWLITKRHGWSINARETLPAPGYVHRGAPAPFVPYSPPAPAPTAPRKSR